MNFFKRAFASITRRKGKSLILFAVVLILGNVIAGAIAIQQSTKNVEKQMKAQLGGLASLVLDHKLIEETSTNGEDVYKDVKMVSRDVIKKIGENSAVKNFDYSTSSYYEVEQLKTHQPEANREEFAREGEGNPSYAIVKGVNYAPLLDIQQDIIELADGRVFNEDDMKQKKYVCIISDKMAELNNLSVGDDIVIDRTTSDYNNVGDSVGKYVENVAFEVIGTFQLLKVKQSDDKKSNQMDREWLDQDQINTIYVPADVLYESDKSYQLATAQKFPDMFQGPDGEGQVYTEETYDQWMLYDAVYILKNPESIERFKEEVAPLLPKYYKVEASSDQFDSVAKPIRNMEKMAKMVIIIAVSATILIIALVVILFLRDRKHELGIYLSLGERRGRVMGQILLEVFVIAFIAISLSVFTGSIIAKQTSEKMLKTSTENTVNEDYGYYSVIDRYQKPLSMEDIVDVYAVKLTPTYIVMFYLVGLGTVLISSIVPLIYILRLNPKKIMM